MKTDHIDLADNGKLFFQCHRDSHEWRFVVRLADGSELVGNRTYADEAALLQALRDLVDKINGPLSGWTGRQVMAELVWRGRQSYWVPTAEDRDPDLHQRAAEARARARGEEAQMSQQNHSRNYVDRHMRQQSWYVTDEIGHVYDGQHKNLAVLQDIRELLTTLVRQFNHIEIAIRDLAETKDPVFPPLPTKYAYTEAHGTSIDQLELSTRPVQVLKNAGVRTLGDLLKMTEAELMRQPNFGRKSLNEIKAILAEHGLVLGCPID